MFHIWGVSFVPPMGVHEHIKFPPLQKSVYLETGVLSDNHFDTSSIVSEKKKPPCLSVFLHQQFHRN